MLHPQWAGSHKWPPPQRSISAHRPSPSRETAVKRTRCGWVWVCESWRALSKKKSPGRRDRPAAWLFNRSWNIIWEAGECVSGVYCIAVQSYTSSEKITARCKRNPPSHPEKEKYWSPFSQPWNKSEMLSQSLVVNMWRCNDLRLKMPKKSKVSFFLLLPKGRTFRIEFYVSYFFFGVKLAWTGRRERNLNDRMTGNYCDPPLRKPSHHVVRPYRSPGGSEKDCGTRRESGGQRGVRMKVQGGIMFLSKSGCFDFYHAQWKGWHFGNALFLTLAFQINKSL